MRSNTSESIAALIATILVFAVVCFLVVVIFKFGKFIYYDEGAVTIRQEVERGIEECESTLPRNRSCGYEIIYSEEIE